MSPAAPDLILGPVAAQLALVVFLYAWLTFARFVAVVRQERRYSDLQFPGGDAPGAARIAANLSNQFELGPLFHLLAITLWMTDAVTGLQLWLAWAFFIGRLAHTLVQTLTGNVVMRGLVFSVNFLDLVGMWALFLAAELV